MAFVAHAERRVVKTILRFWKCCFGPSLCFLILIGLSPQCKAQSPLNLRGAIDRALASRADLGAEADRVSIARGSEKQARLIANPTFQFENQNLRPGQTYLRDVDTYAYLSQPLDILGKRKQRIAVASQNVASSEAEYDLARRRILEEVQRSYWEARGAQEIREILKATVENFRAIVDYHSAQFTAGAIPEQDLLRIRLESERLQIDADLAVIGATRTQFERQRQIGQIDFPELVLSEPLDSNGSGMYLLDIQQVA